ncbi:MAG: threonine synthase, partial [Lachnospiraceae bacterium]|nr:threonine synthase [Lachnospiraceae bacterium]
DFPWKETIGLTPLETASRILSYFLTDFEEIPGVVERAYRDKFDTPELTPVKKVGKYYVLELFHGPTLAFKDVALSALPVLMSEARKQLKKKENILILTATSGDTGKAAMEGFKDVPGTGIIVFYPYGGVSPVQELQMSTAEGCNVRAAAVRGNFDDTQTGVKQSFGPLGKKLENGGSTVLSSANSINIGRLVPQIAYYFNAYTALVKDGVITAGDEIDFTVPTGNFGDILAGWYAKKMGLPVRRLVCASNKNNVLKNFIDTGVYDKNRPFYRTVSPSMDILVSSNLERLLYDLSDGSCETVKTLMKQLSEDGKYEISSEMLAKLQAGFAGEDTGEEDTVGTIRRVFDETGYLIDTHTAVAFSGAEVYEKDCGAKVPNVILSTASAYKFPDAVAEALGITGEFDAFSVMDEIAKVSSTAAPERLRTLREKNVRFSDVIDISGMSAYVEKALQDGFFGEEA